MDTCFSGRFFGWEELLIHEQTCVLRGKKGKVLSKTIGIFARAGTLYIDGMIEYCTVKAFS